MNLPEETTVELAKLKLQNNWLKEQVDLARDRTAYPKFCKHPGKCAGAGSCKAEWVCND